MMRRSCGGPGDKVTAGTDEYVEWLLVLQLDTKMEAALETMTRYSFGSLRFGRL
jgi:hypothetical protein